MKLYRIECKESHYGPFHSTAVQKGMDTLTLQKWMDVQRDMGRRHAVRKYEAEDANRAWGADEWTGPARFAMLSLSRLCWVFAEAIRMEPFQVLELHVPDEWAVAFEDGQVVYHSGKVEKVRQLNKENLPKTVAESAA